jgi:hypothetical protein
VIRPPLYVRGSQGWRDQQRREDTLRDFLLCFVVVLIAAILSSW